MLALLLGAYACATFWPEAGRTIRTAAVFSLPVPAALLAVLLFVAGLAIDLEQMATAFRRLRLTLLVQLSFWGIPLGIVFALGAFAAWLPPGLLAGLGLVALMPAAGSSVAWCQLSRGNIALSLEFLTVTTLLSPFVIILGERLTMTEGLGVGASVTAVGLVGWIIVAVVAGIGIRRWVGVDRIAARRSQIRLLNTTVLVLLNYANASLALPQVFTKFDGSLLSLVVLTTAAVCCGSFAMGWLLTWVFRVEVPVARAFVFGLGMKNTGMALVLGGIWFTSQPWATVAIILYTLMQHLLAALYHKRALALRDLDVGG